MAKSTTYKGAVKPFGKSGHFHEPRRHSLQARGIRTGNLASTFLPAEFKENIPTQKKKMTPEAFDEYWWDGGDNECIEKYDRKIKESDIKRQPSYKLYKDKNNAYIEAVWEIAYKDMVGGK